MRVWSLVAIAIAVFVGSGGIGLAFYGGMGGNAALMWAGIVIVALAVAGAWYAYALAAKEGKAAFLAALTSNFRADQSQWFHSTGLALDYSAGRLLIADRGLIRIYDLDQVQGFEPRLGIVYSAGGSNNPISAVITIFLIPSMIRDSLENGLYINVNDPAYPRWHIYGIDASATEAWIAMISAEKTRRTAATA